MKFSILSSLLAAFLLISCKQKSADVPADAKSEPTVTASQYETTGSIERLDPRLDALIDKDAKIEVLANGYSWTEGPLWIEDGGYVIYSEIPSNTIYKWKEGEGASVYLTPSGYTGEAERGGEVGSNGLLLDPDGALVLCQHGNRKMARMMSPVSDPQPLYQTIVGEYEGKKFNSPNDAIYDSQGNLFFTDPPYGLEGNADDPSKEIPFQGVFRYSTEGQLTLLSDNIYRPNGIDLSVDEKTLYVASSEGKPMWTAFTLDESGGVVDQRVFFDMDGPKEKGAPDGLKVDAQGIIWATGPGGVWVFHPDGTLLGKIKTGEATSNCAFDAEEKTLYMTCDDYLMRIKLRA